MIIKRTKILIALFVAVFFLTLCCAASYRAINVAMAEETSTSQEEKIEAYTQSNSEEISPMALLVNLSLSIDSGDGQVWATVKNEFTLFPGTVQVYVELYSSLTYQDSYETMKLESRGYISDLDQGETISTYASTNGVEKYWQARLYSKVDNGSWSSKTTRILLIDGNGDLLKQF